MKAKTIYIADDGKVFTDELECVEYELQNALNAKGIVFYDASGEVILDATLAYEIEISCDKDLKELWEKVYSYCGAENLPMSKGTWEWQTGQENRIFCKNCSYHCKGTGGWTCQSNGSCYEGGWVKVNKNNI